MKYIWKIEKLSAQSLKNVTKKIVYNLISVKKNVYNLISVCINIIVISFLEYMCLSN